MYFFPAHTTRSLAVSFEAASKASTFSTGKTLLAHVEADKELCARLNISNIMVRPYVEPSGMYQFYLWFTIADNAASISITGIACPQCIGEGRQ